MRLRQGQRLSKASRGFTLLEVMLAFVIFALSFAVVLEILAGSMRGIRRAEDDTQVALIAQSLMDQVGIVVPLQEGEYSGNQMDRYEWRLGIYRYGSAGADAYAQELADLSGVALYQVTLDIEWDAGRRERSAYFSTVRSALASE